MKRVHLTWNRNRDNDTRYYRIYRSEYPIIDTYNRDEFLIMRVKHPKAINAVRIEGETLERISDRTFLLKHNRILLDFNGETFPFVIKVDGEVGTLFTLDSENGRIVFDEPLDKESVVFAEEYTFDGVDAWDYGIDELLKSYYGPDAKDIAAPTIPQGVRMTPDYNNNRILIEWESSSTEGKLLYYRIDSIEERSSYSQLSQWETVLLKEDLADTPYIVEKSMGGTEWRQIARVKRNHVYEYLINKKAPDPISKLSADFRLIESKGKSIVALKWNEPKTQNATSTSMYRIKAVNKVNSISEPSNVVGPIPFEIDLKEIVIRRKKKDGTIPSFNGDDAITVATLLPENTRYEEVVTGGEDYTYGLYIVDFAGNVSSVTYTNIDIKDNLPPNPVLILSASEFSLCIG